MEAFLTTRPAFEEDLREGDFSHLREWLRQSIYRHGHALSADTLIRRATGQPLGPEAFLRRLASRHA